MHPARKYFLKLFAYLLVAGILQRIFHIGAEWTAPLWILDGLCLVLVLAHPLGMPLHTLWTGYMRITSQGMRFLQGMGLALLLIAYYRLRYHVLAGNAGLLADLYSGVFPMGGYRYWGIAGLALLLVGLLRVAANPLFDLWMKVADGIQFVMSRVILTMVFVFTVLPMGFFARAFGKRFLERYIDREGASYWIDRPAIPFDEKRYTRMF